MTLHFRSAPLLTCVFVLGVLPAKTAEAAGAVPRPVDDSAAETQIRALWERFQQALRGKDVEGAAACFIPSQQVHSRELFRDMFKVNPELLSQFAHNLALTERVYVRGDVAKYRVGRLQRQTTYVYLNQMPDGAWLLERFEGEAVESVPDDPAADGQIRGVWERLRRALEGKDVEAALGCFIPSRQDGYRAMFQTNPELLPRLAHGMALIEKVYIHDEIAKYRLRRPDTVRGQPQEITHYIYFFQMPDGTWLVDSF